MLSAVEKENTKSRIRELGSAGWGAVCILNKMAKTGLLLTRWCLSTDLKKKKRNLVMMMFRGRAFLAEETVSANAVGLRLACCKNSTEASVARTE